MSLIAAMTNFQELGCTDDRACAAGARVYLDLLRDKNITNMEPFFDAESNRIYIRAKRTGNPIVVVPVLSSLELDIFDLNNVQMSYGSQMTKEVTVAICDSASNVLYYDMKPGIFERL